MEDSSILIMNLDKLGVADLPIEKGMIKKNSNV